MDSTFPDALTLPRRLLRLRRRGGGHTDMHAAPSSRTPASDLAGGAAPRAPLDMGGDLGGMMDAVARFTARARPRLGESGSIVVPWSGLELRGDHGPNSLPSDDDRRHGRTRLISFTKARSEADAEWVSLPVHLQAFVAFRP